MRDSELPEDPPSVAVAGELHCIECMYDLRMLPVDGMCPECGCHIRRTMEHWELITCRKMPFLNRLLLTLLKQMLVGGVIFCVLLFAISTWSRGIWDGLFRVLIIPASLLLLFHLFYACYFIGATRTLFPLRWHGCLWPIGLFATSTLLAIVKTIANFPAFASDFLILIGVIYLGFFVVAEVVVVSANTLALRLNMKRTGRWAKLTMWGVSIHIVFMLAPNFTGYHRHLDPQHARTAEAIMLACRFATFFAFLISYVILFWLLYRKTKTGKNSA